MPMRADLVISQKIACFQNFGQKTKEMPYKIIELKAKKHQQKIFRHSKNSVSMHRIQKKFKSTQNRLKRITNQLLAYF